VIVGTRHTGAVECSALYYQVDDLNDAPRSAKCKAVIWDARSAW